MNRSQCKADKSEPGDKISILVVIAVAVFLMLIALGVAMGDFSDVQQNAANL